MDLSPPRDGAVPPTPRERPPIPPSPPAAVLIAWAAYAVAWLVPAVRLMPHDPKPMAGWQAFAAALTMATRPDRIDWFWAICVAGVLANIGVLMTVWQFHRTSGVLRWFAYAMAAAFAVNLLWIPFLAGSILMPGYWLWIGAIGALAVTAMVLNRAGVTGRGGGEPQPNSPRGESR